jgi:hypothetical protein
MNLITRSCIATLSVYETPFPVISDRVALSLKP